MKKEIETILFVSRCCCCSHTANRPTKQVCKAIGDRERVTQVDSKLGNCTDFSISFSNLPGNYLPETWCLQLTVFCSEANWCWNTFLACAPFCLSIDLRILVVLRLRMLVKFDWVERHFCRSDQVKPPFRKCLDTSRCLFKLPKTAIDCGKRSLDQTCQQSILQTKNVSFSYLFFYVLKFFLLWCICSFSCLITLLD